MSKTQQNQTDIKQAQQEATVPAVQVAQANEKVDVSEPKRVDNFSADYIIAKRGQTYGFGG